MQDVAVIPLLLLLPLIAAAGAGPEAYRGLGGVVTRGILLMAVLFVLARTLLPLLFHAAATARNRELFVILVLTFCLGATWASHAFGLSEVIGAFVAGVLLADTKYASQIRAEIGALRSRFLALFFVSIGMLANPAWVARHALLVVALVAVIVVGKTAIAAIVVNLLGYSTRVALGSGLALASAIVAAARTLRPDLLVVARARYAQYAQELVESGTEVLLNEEELMGEHLAAVSLKLLGLASDGVARVEPPGGTTASPATEDGAD